ncbi:ABC transporter substrate-binding protein [Nocardioidaceae bacterium]|nr:ABC transporter substrate-binding protein [Nocardioidaceae bacterium]
MHRRRLAAAAVLPLLALGACGGEESSQADTGSSSSSSDSSSAPESEAEFPLTIQHAFGETVIEEPAERVATVAWANQEVALALGVVPVGMPEVTYGDDDGDGVLPWVEDKLEELGAETPVLFDEVDGIDYEAVASTEPDVILAAYSGLTQEEYETLSRIAPVVAFPEIPWGTDVAQTILLDSAGMGLPQQGEEFNDQLQQSIDEDFAEHPELEGASVMFAYFDPADLSQIGFYTTVDPRPGFLADNGMVTPTAVAEASEGSEEFYTTLSAEQADRFDDVDLIVTYGTDDTLATLQDDLLLSQIPAVAEGRVAVLDDSSPEAVVAGITPLSLQSELDDYLETLSEALAGDSGDSDDSGNTGDSGDSGSEED